jgi:TolB-like protein
MKSKWVLVLGMVALAATVCAPIANAASTRPVVAVLYFETEGCKSYLAAVTARYLMTAVAYKGTYEVVTPEKIDKIMEGSGVADGGAISSADAIKLGKKLGAAIVCRGKVSREGEQFTVTVDFLSTATGTVVSTKSSKVTGEANISKAIDTIIGLTS